MTFVYIGLGLNIAAVAVALCGAFLSGQGREWAYPYWEPNRPVWKTYVALIGLALASYITAIITALAS